MMDKGKLQPTKANEAFMLAYVWNLVYREIFLSEKTLMVPIASFGLPEEQNKKSHQLPEEMRNCSSVWKILENPCNFSNPL